MEPISIWVFTMIAAGLGVGLSLTGKKKPAEEKSAPVVKTVKHQEAAPVEAEATTDAVIDAEKEKAIDELIANKN
ncbi:MAG: hypothetical protein HQL22_06365 [Candidatus Omnitrophica bacterium]|nr:hypothetical protein [Candidatus Omnitrophota bacterium]